MVQGTKIVSLLIALLLALSLHAQDSQITFGENSIEYKKQILGGLTIHTQGFGINLAFAESKTAFKRRMLNFEFVTMKHPKEYKISNPYVADSKRFVFGKINSLMILRPSIGYKTLVFDKLRKSGVEISYGWAVGPAIGLVKPVYLEVIRIDEVDKARYLSIEKSNPDDVTQRDIYGRASFFKGFDQLRITPGVHFKLYGIFEYSQNTQGIKGIETGATLDLFAKKIPILGNNLNSAAYLNLYLNFFFGKKYNGKLSQNTIENNNNGVGE